jgi:hypothetical protein
LLSGWPDPLPGNTKLPERISAIFSRIGDVTVDPLLFDRKFGQERVDLVRSFIP